MPGSAAVATMRCISRSICATSSSVMGRLDSGEASATGLDAGLAATGALPVGDGLAARSGVGMGVRLLRVSVAAAPGTVVGSAPSKL